MKNDKLDLYWIISLIAIALSNLFIVLFCETEMWMAAFVALVIYVISLIIWLVLFIIQIVRLSKKIKKWKQ